MTALPEARSRTDVPSAAAEWRSVLLAFLTVVLIGVAIGLVITGMDALNDLLAQGFTSIGRPSG